MWTKEKPKEEGYYWQRMPPSRGAEVVQATLDRRGEIYIYAIAYDEPVDGTSKYAWSDDYEYWSEKIKEPRNDS